MTPDPDPAPDDLSTWLSVQEAARAYGVDQRTIRRRIKAGTLAARQVVGAHGPAEYRIPPPPGYTRPLDDAPPPEPRPELAAALAIIAQQAETIERLRAQNEHLVGQLATLADRLSTSLPALPPVSTPPALPPGPAEPPAPRPWWRFWGGR